MKERTIRVGIFSRRTSPFEGGADTLLKTLAGKVTALSLGGSIELVPVPWQAWSQRRNPLRFAWLKIARLLGIEIPEVDVRPLCRRLRLDLAYFTVPAFVEIDVPFVFTLWDIGHRTIPEFPEMRIGRVPWTQREALCRRMLAQASYVVVGNQTGAAEARDFFGLSVERVVAIPFPNPDFSEITELAVPWLPAGPFFLFPAQFWPHKNHFTLLRALTLLASNGGAVPTLVFVGSDQGNAAYLKSAAAELGVAQWVRFAGFVPRGELKALYRQAIGLVFPSLLGPNNLPPQEATVMGCPVILSDLPGHREEMRDGALFVPALDAAGWAEAMRRLMAEPDLRAQLVARAQIATAACTVENYTTRLGGLLRGLAARRMLWGPGSNGPAV